MILTDAQLMNEIARCEFCEDKPCTIACPVGCSPADFLMAVKQGNKSDYKRAAAKIMSMNPLGSVCGNVCPDKHCMAACSRKTFDNPINIPDCQATIMAKARELDVMPEFKQAPINNKTVAIVGGGPAGWGSAVVLSQMGYTVEIFERESTLGGAINYIPDTRLDKEILWDDFKYFTDPERVSVCYDTEISSPQTLLKDFDAVIVSAGLWKILNLDIDGTELGLGWDEFLKGELKLKQSKVAIIGGGAIALDCASKARHAGASVADMIMLENTSEMLLSKKERQELLDYGISPICRTRLTLIDKESDAIAVYGERVNLKDGEKFSLKAIEGIPGTEHLLGNYDYVVWAIGSRANMSKDEAKGLFYAGDLLNGASTVVEAVASGKNAAMRADAFINTLDTPVVENELHSDVELYGTIKIPVDISCDFFGKKLISPFLLSAAPPSDGYDQMKLAFDAGWAGGVMKTVFDGLDIHIPSEYMFKMTEDTYANCDNVSGHTLERTASEAKCLVAEYPDRLVMVSTGGPVTGNDAEDKAVWQSNTLKLEKAGVNGVEYSLSCPQGGDGTEGDIVSQNAQLTGKIVDWIMEISDPEVPKLFKLTGAITSIVPILRAIKEVFNKYPNKKAGVTLANSFPSLAFRAGDKENWDEGIVVGLSGEGVKNISNLTLANASAEGLYISGNGGPMDYKAAADFLALGVGTVQFCTAPTKYGVNYISDLQEGLSYYMQERGIKSIAELRGCALPAPITDFMDLSPIKKISDANSDLCVSCGNCTRCPYLAVTLNEDGFPETDPEKCIGCSICVQKCFTGAMYMRDRTPEERDALKE